MGILLYNGHEFIEVYLALAKIGAALVPLNWRMAPPEIAAIVRDAEPRLVVFDATFSDLALFLKENTPGLELFLTLGTEDLSWADRYEVTTRCSSLEPIAPGEVDPEDPHVILYSSGTTGVPKGVVLSHRKTFYNVLNSDILFRLMPGDVFLVNRPLFHSGGLLFDSTPAIYKGATLIYKRRFSPVEYLRAIEKYRVTILESSAVFFASVLRECSLDEYDLSSVKSCFTGGERVPESLIREFHGHGIPMSQVFGTSETSTIAWLSTQDARRKVGSVGKPVFHGEVKIVAPGGREVGPGEVGEVVVRGPILMSGYWRNPDLTAEAVRDGWYHTADLARRDEEGFLYIVDRKKDMYISGGENVYPAEVEKVLISHPKILDAAVCGVPDERWGEVGKAWIILARGQRLTEEEILRFLDGKVGRYKIPKHIEFTESFPRTASGKIQKYLLLGGERGADGGGRSGSVFVEDGAVTTLPELRH